MSYRLLVGNVIDKLAEVEPESVQLIVSSPCYYRMRRYFCDFVWGGDRNCEHDWSLSVIRAGNSSGGKTIKQSTNAGSFSVDYNDRTYKSHVCSKCGAWKGELGWEDSPELYVSHLCDVFDLARVALKDDGVCFVNLGDTFAQERGSGEHTNGKQKTNGGSLLGRQTVPTGYKQKDLLLIPFLFASEMRRRGWYLRAEIPWICPNKMPGPWKDRPIIGHEWFLMFTKSSKCSYDADKVLVETTCADQFGRNRRTSDTFMESLDGSIQFYKDYIKHLEGIRNGKEGLLVDESGNPLALVVNNHPSSLKHFAMYNEHLIEPLIKSSTVEGDVVLDPFSGTASTGACALRLGRKYIGIDAKEEYSEMGRKRLDKIEDMPVQATIFDMV